MKKIFEILTSLKLTLILLLSFAFSIGIATFIENDFGTETALADIYRARWFEVLLAVLSINLVLVFIKFKMYKFKRWYVSLFHISFIIVVLGAYLTRYIGFEGTMHIREGHSSNYILSSKSFININIDGHLVNSTEKLFSNISTNRFNFELDNIKIKLQKYIPYASYKYEKSKSNGISQVSMMIAIDNGFKPLTVNLKQGDFYDLGFKVIDFNSNYSGNKTVIRINKIADNLELLYENNISGFSMDTKETSQFGTKTNLHKRMLYKIDDISVVFKAIEIDVEKILMSNMSMSKTQREQIKSAMIFQITSKNEQKELLVFGQSGTLGISSSINIDGKNIEISYGSKTIELPFSIYLKDFQLDRYAGSMSPSSYASEVILQDGNLSKDYRIFMNNVLDYKGFRLFQSSYDKDEGGTILSVNYDPGTSVTYLGYFLMFLGLFSVLFGTKSRFQKLRRDLAKLGAMFLFLAISTSSDLKAEKIQIETINTIFQFDKAHSNKFGELLVQDSSGRTKPLDSLNMEIIHKIYRGDDISGLNSNQIILGMILKPDLWKQINMIYTKDIKVNKIIGLDTNQKYASFGDFFTNPQSLSGYKLEKYIADAMRVPPKKRGKFEKSILKIDERVNVAYMVYSGSLLRIFPKPNDSNNKWVNTIDALQTFDKESAIVVRNMIILYFQNIDKSLQSGNWVESDKALQNISIYQEKIGQAIYIDKTRIQAEIFYNKAKIFPRLIPYTFSIGLILLIIGFVTLLNPQRKFIKTLFVLKSGITVIFTLYTIGLILRWYISGHAPWTDAYESLVYIGWATLLAGFIFSKSSPFILASTTILSGTILFVANLSWLDPQITNLVPVLKSYWLTIHVSLITASYGFLALGSFLGLLVLILFIITNEQNKDRFVKPITELGIVGEMNMIIGLVLLTIGNFLGGVWANESWGRYWGWDSKETWALVTILIYTAVLHIRLVPKLYSKYLFSLVSLLAFSSVLMTYFGVNFYLSGMHSYAQGDPVPIPTFVYYMIATIGIISILAFRKRNILK